MAYAPLVLIVWLVIVAVERLLRRPVSPAACCAECEWQATRAAAGGW